MRIIKSFFILQLILFSINAHAGNGGRTVGNGGDVLKCSVFVSDMNNYSRINAIYAEYFDDSTAPARELVEVANLPKFVNVEISAIAAAK